MEEKREKGGTTSLFVELKVDCETNGGHIVFLSCGEGEQHHCGAEQCNLKPG